jgi:hypothetical protein
METHQVCNSHIAGFASTILTLMIMFFCVPTYRIVVFPFSEPPKNCKGYVKKVLPPELEQLTCSNSESLPSLQGS